MTNQNTTTSNQELLSWAVENIKEWNDDYTHLRSDSPGGLCTPYFTSGDGWRVGDTWVNEWTFCGHPNHHEELEQTFLTPKPQVITKQEWEQAIAAKNAPTSSSEPLQGHVHAELMAEYALVAKTNPEPWREFEVLNSEVKGWEDLETNPRWFAYAQYRRKPTPPKTMNIGGIVVEAWPLDKLPTTKVYWSVTVLGGTFRATACDINYVPGPHRNRLDTGKAFSTEEQAQAVADALNLVYNRALGKPEA